MDDFRAGAIKNVVLGASLRKYVFKMSLAKEAAFIMEKACKRLHFFPLKWL